MLQIQATRAPPRDVQHLRSNHKRHPHTEPAGIPGSAPENYWGDLIPTYKLVLYKLSLI